MDNPQLPVPELPAPCRMSAVPDCYAIWRQLADLWLAQPVATGGPIRTSRGLADHLGVPAQNVSQWKTGSGDKSAAPWFLIMRLALELDVLVVLDPRDGARLHARVA